VRKFGLMLALAAGFLVAADAPSDAVKKEKAKLKGAWIIQSALKDGEVPNDKSVGKHFTILDEKITLGDGKKADDFVSYTIDPTQRPAAMDVKLLDERLKDKEKEMKAIYSLKGDTLTLCVALPGEARPTKFSGDKGTRASLIVLKRAKP
jgi:uncharacterized protein (TIGR03067 family)